MRVIDKCKPLKAFCRNDTLDEQVAALPPLFTSRFGEIVWAAGGVGFGWWPACIYDPRLTVGGARKLALKNIGKKHLVYFFACDAPFTVLLDTKCMSWEMGMLEEYDLGKTAKAMGKTREWMFEWALQAAIAENDKPIECRLDWNHEEDSTVVTGKPPVNVNKPSRNSTGSAGGKRSPGNNGSSTKKKAKKDKNEKSGSSSSTKEYNDVGEPVKIMSSLSSSSTSISPSNPMVPTRRSNRERKPSRSFELAETTVTSPIELLSTNTPKKSSLTTINIKIPKSPASLSHNEEDTVFFCKVCRNDEVVSFANDDCNAFDSSLNVGFVTLPSSKLSTFADARSIMKRDLDEDCLPSKWKFYVPNLGPLSRKQETRCGPMLIFLKNATNTVQFGDGSSRNPLKVAIYSSK